MALGGDGFAVSTAAAPAASTRLRAAGAEVAACLERTPARAHRTLLLLSDGLAGDQQEIVRGAYDVAGASVPLVGGCAGDDLAMQATYSFGLRVIAEGIEVDAQRARLLELDCPAGQGSLFSRPLDPEAFARLLGRPAGGGYSVEGLASSSTPATVTGAAIAVRRDSRTSSRRESNDSR